GGGSAQCCSHIPAALISPGCPQRPPALRPDLLAPSCRRPNSSDCAPAPEAPRRAVPRSSAREDHDRPALPGPVLGERQHRAVRCEQSDRAGRSEEHTSELQSRENLVCRLLLEKKKVWPVSQP